MSELPNTNRNKRKSPPESLQSYNHWVAQLSNNDSTAPRLPTQHHQHLPQQQQHGRIMTQQQQLRGTNSQQQYPPNLLARNTSNNNPQLNIMGGVYRHSNSRQEAPPTTTNAAGGVNASERNNTATHPASSLSYLSITNQNNNNDTKHALPPPHHLHHSPQRPQPPHPKPTNNPTRPTNTTTTTTTTAASPKNHILEGFTTQQIAALRALNGGSESSAFQIDLMNAMIAANNIASNAAIAVNTNNTANTANDAMNNSNVNNTVKNRTAANGVNTIANANNNANRSNTCGMNTNANENRAGVVQRGAAANGPSKVGYISHTNYAMLGGDGGGNGPSAVAAAGGGGMGGAAKRQRVQPQQHQLQQQKQPPPQQQLPLQQQQQAPSQQQLPLQQQQHQNLFTTGTTLVNYNSTIPTSTGLQIINSNTVLANITRRILNECRYLCLLPNERYIMEEGRDKRFKSTNQLLRGVVTLLYSLLNLESPNPASWNDNDDDDDDTTFTTTTPTCADWIKGTQCKLHGPQPWQCTLPFIANAVYQLFDSEGYTDWFTSECRWGTLEVMVRPVIVRSLIAWKPNVFGREGGRDGVVLVERYSKLIWNKFRMERLETIVDCKEALIPPQIGFEYICKVASGCEDWKEILEREKPSAAPEVVDLLVADDDGGEMNDRMDTSTSVEVSPDSVAVAICLPVGQDGGGDFNWESKWNCDYCSASFSNFDQAVIHEKECKAKSQAVDGSGNNVVLNNDVEYAIEEKWMCDHCTESFPTYDEAVAHENECKVKSQAAEVVVDDGSKSQELSETDGGNAVENNVEYALKEKWKCEHFSASFSVYDSAVAHENECKAKSQAPEAAKDDGSKSEASPETEEINDGETDVMHVNECRAMSLTAEAAKDNDSKSREGPETKESKNDDAVQVNECQAKLLTAEAAVDDNRKGKETPETKESSDGDDRHVNECQAKLLTAETAVDDEVRENPETKGGNDGDVKHPNKSPSKSLAAEAAIEDESKTKTSPETKEGKDGGEAGVYVASNVEDVIEERWKCDHCSASFSLNKEAVAHENECKAKSRAVEASIESKSKQSSETMIEINDGETDVDVESNVGEVIEEKLNSVYCSTSFSSYDEAVAHENECKAEPQEVVEKVDEILGVNETDEAAKQSSVKGREGFILKEKWKCYYCPASFLTFDDAALHERKCKAKIQSAAAANAATDVEFQSNDECAEKRVNDAMEEQWQCDYCKALFSVFDEAAAHEAQCKRLSEAATSLPGNSSIPERDAEISSQYSEILDVESGTEFSISNELRTSMLQTLELLRYEYFPLMSGGDERLGEVCEKVLKCMHFVTPVTNGNEATSKREVERVLNHLEHQSGYLSSLNGLFRVRVNTTALLDDSGNSKSSAQAVRSTSSEPEDTEEVVVTYGLNSDGDQVIMAASSPEQGAAGSRIPQSIVTNTSDRSTPCGECILCSAPDCERCYACLSRGQTGSDVCIRKSCCKIPFEDKAKTMVGFPRGWQYAFCDPNQGFFAKAPRQVLSLAGLVMRRPLPAGYQYFHSFQAAFSVVQHKDIQRATNLVESFLAHVHGSGAIISYPEHFLVGKRFCFEFTNINGMNVAMFGVISTCFREGCEAETDIFMIEYDSDCIEIALKSLGTNIPRLQLISSGQAWGGCISFERKARIHGCHSVVRSIDQATAVEYWVTPDMRMEEMVEQEDGIKVPMLTILLRGYKFVFSAHNDDEGIAVSVSCVSMNGDKSNNEKSILKPGELIDLGVFCPLLESDTKPLPVFMLKNYIHGFSIDSYAGDGNGNVYDLTDDKKGTMHTAADMKLLSYVRSCNETEVPTIHGGLDPSGKVHLLFGVRYRGDWKEYSSIKASEIQPIFSGEQREVNLARNLMINDHQEGKYLSAITNLGPEEIMQCAEFVGSLFLGSPTVVLSVGVRERVLRAANCLRHRISDLTDPRLNVADQLVQHTIDLVQASRQQHNNNQI